MPITPVQYQPRPYVRGGTLGDLLRLQGQHRAEAELRGGDIAAQLWANLGNQIGSAIQGYAKERQEAPIRAQEAESRALTLQSQRQQVDERDRLNRQDTAFSALLEMFPDGNVPPKEVMSIYGPQRGVAIAQGLTAFSELASQKVKDAQANAGRLAIGLKALSPELQQQMWPRVREAAIAGGLGSAEQIPEQLTPEFLDGVIGWATGQQPQAPALTQVDPEKDLFIGTELVRRGTPAAQTPPNPTEASLAAAAARGDASAAEALRLLRQQNAPAGPRTPIWVIQDGKFVDLAGVAPPGSQPANTREQGRPVTSGDAGRMADFDTSLDDLAVLSSALTSADATGFMARVGARMPNPVTEFTGWGTDAKSKQALIDRVKQVIGKTLEGGVLRKEDEVKYERILPTIGDPPEIVRSKLQGLQSAIAQRRTRFLESLDDAGFDTTNFPEQFQPRGPATPPAPSQATPNLSGLREGFEREITTGPYKGQVWTIHNGEAVRVR